MKNIDIRQEAQQAKVKLWQIAEILGMADSNFSKLLRRELSTEQKEKIRSIIYSIAKEANHNDN